MKKGIKKEEILALFFIIIFFIIIFLPNNFNNSNEKENIKKIKVSSDSYNYGGGGELIIIKEDRKIDYGTYEFSEFRLKNSKLTINFKPGHSGSLIIRASKKIYIDKNSIIDVSGTGQIKKDNEKPYIPGKGLLYDYAGGGGTFGGLGGSGSCEVSNETEIGNIINIENDYGRDGGFANKIEGEAGVGGGYLLLIAPEIIIEGEIISNGTNGTGSGGGGSGGKVVILSKLLKINGKIYAQGGNGGSSQIQGAGGGSGGLVILSNYSGSPKIITKGGFGGHALDLYTGCSGGDGKSGDVILAEIL